MNFPNASGRFYRVLLFGAELLLAAFAMVLPMDAQTNAAATERQHPALFLVGDSIMKTGTGDGSKGPWGWGAEIIPMFDTAKIHVYNEGRGGRSSRGYIEEGLWVKVLADVHSGDYVIIQFGHNDSANSASYPDRTTLQGNGDETQEMESPVTHQKETIHSYGWYLRQYIQDVKGKGATAIICSPTPRNEWVGGKIKRGFDGYAQWAEAAAKAGGALFLPLNDLAADRWDALGEEKGRSYFNDTQHTTKAGAKLHAEAVAAGIRQVPNCPLAGDLLPAAQ
jgi:rhamnogalacturonan acetylesterase